MLEVVEKGCSLRGFQGPGSTEVGDAAGVSDGCHQRSHQGLSHAGLTQQETCMDRGGGRLAGPS